MKKKEKKQERNNKRKKETKKDTNRKKSRFSEETALHGFEGPVGIETTLMGLSEEQVYE